MRFLSKLGAVFLLIACVQSARAAPILSATTSDLGGGLFAYDIVLDGQDGNYSSFFAQTIAFTGEILGFASWHFDDDPFASYLYEPWTNNGMGAPAYSANGLSFSAGTGGGSQYLSLPVARLVVAGDLSVSGSIGRDGLLYDFAGSFFAAESFATIASLLGPNQGLPEVPVAPPEFVAVPPVEPGAPQDPQQGPVVQPVWPVDQVFVIENPTIPPGQNLPQPTELTGEPDGLVSHDEWLTREFFTQGGNSVTTAISRDALAAPEPATWVLATTGLLVVGVLGRLGRRR